MYGLQKTYTQTADSNYVQGIDEYSHVSMLSCMGRCIAIGWSPSKESCHMSQAHTYSFIINSESGNGRGPNLDTRGGRRMKLKKQSNYNLAIM